MRISDWSSDVCSSDLVVWMIAVRIMRRSPSGREERVKPASRIERGKIVGSADMALIDKHLRHCCMAIGALKHLGPLRPAEGDEIGRASCRERVCQDV